MHLQSQTANLTSNQADKRFRTESTGPTEEGKEKEPPTRETKKECSEVRGELGEFVVIEAKRAIYSRREWSSLLHTTMVLKVWFPSRSISTTREL